MEKAGPCGIVNVYKEKDWTSFDVVAVMRRIFGLRRVGHCGTLDPFAEGVLPIFLGRATSAVRYTEDYDKRYTVSVAFGQATETQDLTGEVIGGRTPSEHELAELAENDWQVLRQHIAAFVGEQWQIPPMYSAVKIKGEPLYKYARRGEVVDRPPRRITVYHADVLDIRRTSGATPLVVDLDIALKKEPYPYTVSIWASAKRGAYAVKLTAPLADLYLDTAQTVETLRSWRKQVVCSIKPVR